MEALTGCLFRPEAFGPANTWGPEVFTEIGTLAGTEKNTAPSKLQSLLRFFMYRETATVSFCLRPGGLEDWVLSALVQEQLEGITPEALALMMPKKMAVSQQSSWSCHSLISYFMYLLASACVKRNGRTLKIWSSVCESFRF